MDKRKLGIASSAELHVSGTEPECRMMQWPWWWMWLTLPLIFSYAAVPGTEVKWVSHVNMKWTNYPKTRQQDNFTCPANQACFVLRVTPVNRGEIYLPCSLDRGTSAILASDGTPPQVHVSANVSFCEYTGSPYQWKCTRNLTDGINNVPTSPWWVGNSTIITNRVQGHYMIVTVIPLTPHARDVQIVPIVHTCMSVAHAHIHTTVKWTVKFPPLPNCRARRAWYDTVLGGAGTGLGIINTIDSQVTAHKLDSVGKYVHDAVATVGHWVPKGALQQVYQSYWDIMASRILMDMNTGKEWKNLTRWMNWTECTMTMLNVKIQRSNVQQMLMTSNPSAWRQFWNIDPSAWLHLKPDMTQCNDSLCTGQWEMYDVTTPQTLCRFHVLPIIAGGAYWTLRVKGEWLDVHTNQTYDVRDCDETDKGHVCSLRTGYTNPCFDTKGSVCQWDYSSPKDMLFEVGPHILCVSTVHTHDQLPYVTYSGCLHNTYIWKWQNKTYWLTNHTAENMLTTLQWRVLHSNIGISLRNHAKLLNESFQLIQLAKHHKHNTTQLAVQTIMIKGKLVALGKTIESTARNAWWSIFEGWSPKA